MTCNKYERLLSAYLDRELTPDEAAMVKRHIINCPSCAAALEEYEIVKDALESLEPADMPEGLFDIGVIRTRALAMEIRETEDAPRRIGIIPFIGKALLPAALIGTLVALPILQLAFKVDITGAIAGLFSPPVEQAPVTAVVIPDLSPEGYGNLQIADAAVESAAKYKWIALGQATSSSNLNLSIEDPRLTRYVQSFGTGSSGISGASYRNNW